MRERWASTVLRPMKSSAAISLFERPSAASSATRRSLSVSSSEGARRPLIRRSSARAFSAHSCAPSSSKNRQRLVQRLAGGPLPLRLPAHDAEAEQGAATLERVGQPFQLGEGSLERLESGRQSDFCGSQQAAAAGGGSHRPPTPDTPRVLFVGLEVRARLLKLAER